MVFVVVAISSEAIVTDPLDKGRMWLSLAATPDTVVVLDQ